MGKTSGGVRGSSGKNSGNINIVADKKSTEYGYSNRLKKNIVNLENSIRNKKDEELHVFNANGDNILKVQGKDNKVKLSGVNIPPNMILTHNHPLSLNKTGIESIGNSLSAADIKSAIRYNASEIRAVTPRYTFSVKRPKGGWGIDRHKAYQEYRRIERNTRRRFYNYIHKMGDSMEAIKRAEVLHAHSIMKQLSKKYGWDYTKKKNF